MGSQEASEITVNRIKEITCAKCGSTVDISKAKPLSMIACPECGAEVRVPAQIDHFLLVKKLAAGSSGAVYQAYDENLWRQVALKLVYKSPRTGHDRYDECVREARSMAMLNHRNVVQVFSLSEDMGQPYIVMELVDGGALSSRMREGPLDELSTLRIIRDANAGLAAAHRLRVIHGDVKPENILLTRDDTAKLIDFGLSVRSSKKDEDRTVRGSPFYIAPEVARGDPPTQPSDQYNLGASLFHALSARPPFRGKEIRDVVIKRLKEPPPDLNKYRRDLHPKTTDIVQRMMALRIDDRYPDHESLETDLDVVIFDLESTPAVDTASKAE